MSDYSIDVDELKDTLLKLSDNVQKNSTIITPTQLGSDFMYHISFGRFTEFTPNVSKRAAPSEDNTVARVHVATTLNNAWNGYASGPWTAVTNIPSEKKTKGVNAPYKGGFYVHRVPFRACLKPNKKLVYDSDYTKEHWLVTYNPMTRVFPAVCVGKIITESVTYIPRLNKHPVTITTLVLEVNTPDGMKLTEKVHLKKGYYRYRTSDKYGVMDVLEISKSEFLTIKTSSAAMLSHDDRAVPEFLF